MPLPGASYTSFFSLFSSATIFYIVRMVSDRIILYGSDGLFFLHSREQMDQYYLHEGFCPGGGKAWLPWSLSPGPGRRLRIFHDIRRPSDVWLFLCGLRVVIVAR